MAFNVKIYACFLDRFVTFSEFLFLTNKSMYQDKIKNSPNLFSLFLRYVCFPASIVHAPQIESICLHAIQLSRVLSKEDEVTSISLYR